LGIAGVFDQGNARAEPARNLGTRICTGVPRPVLIITFSPWSAYFGATARVSVHVVFVFVSQLR
jgi:hypothetical protein